MGAMASQITSFTIVYSTVYSDADQRKHQNSASLPFLRGIQRGPVNSPHKWPVTGKMFAFDDVIMKKTHQSSASQTVLTHDKWVDNRKLIGLRLFDLVIYFSQPVTDVSKTLQG